MSNGGKGGNNRRRPFKRHGRSGDSQRNDGAGRQGGRPGEAGREAPRQQERSPDRPRWTAPKLSSEPIPTPPCPICGKPIRDLAMAIADKNSGEPVHFDCIIERIAAAEDLESGDTVTYIGGGRFGIVHFNNPQDTKDFTIKKILEWENRENRAKWRSSLEDHYSVT